MAFANSLHTQYLGTSAGIGLRKVFEMLGQKGLLKQETKEVREVDDLSKLATKTPRELVDLFEKIVAEHASLVAVHKLGILPINEHNSVKRQTVMFATDILPYFDLREAMQIGDIGQMEDLLPTLLFRFTGGSNPKYTIEILELLQKIKREWPPELRDFIQRHCWLVNFIGKCDGFMAVDMAQEHNIKDIKVIWRSFGPGATFAYIQKVSPAIPTLCAVKANIASSHHGTPAKDRDVEHLVKMYQTSKLHTKEAG
ncbi:hypothetical protein V8D89_008014 [Ganoderma adspersum]